MIFFLTQVKEFQFISPRVPLSSSMSVARHKVPSPLRGSGSVSKWPVSGSGVPEERSQSVEDRHRIRTPGREYYRRGNILHTFTRALAE